MAALLPARRLRAAGLVPPLADSLLAAVFVAGSMAEALTSDTARSPLVHALLAVPAMAALAWRRRYPLSVAAAVIATNIAVNPDGEFSTLLALVLVSFTLGAELDAPRSWFALALVAVPFMAAMTYEGLEPSDVAAALVFLAGPWAVGVAMRQRTARTTEAVARAARLEHERDAQNAAAAAQERLRIARELHDIVSHSISVVAIQTQAVRRRLKPEQVQEVQDLAAVETTARQALAEMRRLFGVLRSEGEAPSLAPQPGLGELERLLQQVRAAGLPVELRVTGERIDLPPGADLAAYRIVQEGLTNALRHASAQRASVSLRYLPHTLEVAVEDDGRGPRRDDAGHGGGHGLVGVRERVALYGGTVEFGPASKVGSRLAATLPVRERR
ncbi:hypothetical protein BH24ACT12_BH24ACT12_22450 [soil metagenome]